MGGGEVGVGSQGGDRRFVGANGEFTIEEGTIAAEFELTDEQAAVVRRSSGPVTVFDSHGIVLGSIVPLEFTPEEIADARRLLASDEPRYTTE